MPSLEAKKSLLAALQKYPRLKVFLRNHNSSIRGVKFRLDDKTLVTMSEGGKVTLWDTTTHRVMSDFLVDYPVTLTSVAIDSDGQILAFGHEDGAIMIWDLSNSPPSNQILRADRNAAIAVIGFRPHNAELVSWDRDFNISVWDLTTHKIVDQFAIPKLSLNFEPSQTVFDPAGSVIAIGGCTEYEAGGIYCETSEVRLWSIADHQFLGHPLTDRMGDLRSMSFSPDGSIWPPAVVPI